MNRREETEEGKSQRIKEKEREESKREDRKEAAEQDQEREQERELVLDTIALWIRATRKLAISESERPRKH